MSWTVSQRSERSAEKTSARAWNWKKPTGEGVARERSTGLFARVKEIRNLANLNVLGNMLLSLIWVNKILTYFRGISVCFSPKTKVSTLLFVAHSHDR